MRERTHTYEQIKQFVWDKYARTVKDSWIAHVKELNGLPTRVAPNRGEGGMRMSECPPRMRPRIEDALKFIGLLLLLGLCSCTPVKPQPPLQGSSPVSPPPACVDLRKKGGTC